MGLFILFAMSGRRKSETKQPFLECADRVLGSGNLRLAVTLPEGEDVNEWLAVNTADFYTQINMLYRTISEFCVESTCPKMSAGEKYEYLWADGKKFKKATRLPAPEYIENLMAWVQSALDDENTFPSKMGVPFPRNFNQVVKQIFKRLFRVYAHVYYQHFDMVWHYQEAHI